MMRDMLPKELVPTREGTYHNALEDAIYQAQLIQATWRLLASRAEDAARWQEHALLPPQGWNDFTPAERLLRWPNRDSITGVINSPTPPAPVKDTEDASKSAGA
jgi:hypothetical protein